MKRIILSAVFTATIAVASFGQGTLTFANSPSTLVMVKNGPDPLHAATPVDDTHVELFWAPIGTTDINLFQSIGVVNVGIPAVGRFSGGTRTIPAGSGFTGIAPGGVVSCFIRGWYGGPTWFTALWGDYSGIFTVDTGDPTLTPAGPPGNINTSTATPFTGLIIAIPEPSSTALVLIGSGFVWWKRRRDG